MNDSNDSAPESGATSISAQPTDAKTATTPTKKRLLEEYQDHVGGGGFHSWLSWTHSI